MNALPMLMYHGLHVDAQSRGRFDPVYSVTPQAFARQLDRLATLGYSTVLLDELDDAPGTRRVVITFDDGDLSNIEVALPLLRERRMRAEFFITSDFIDAQGMLSSADVRALAAAGMGIGSHGQTHRFLEDLPADAMTDELRASRQRLEHLCGHPVRSLALPGGRGGIRERRVAQALGFRHLLGSVPGPNVGRRDGGWLQRLAVTRGMNEDDVARLVQWRGLAPRLSLARFRLLQLPKRVLGNAGYERLRARLL